MLDGVRVYIDTETTGLDPKKNSVIQFACVARHEHSILLHKKVLLRPLAGTEFSEAAFKVHGITREVMNEYPIASNGVFEIVHDLKFLRAFGNVELWGHNVSFDIRMLIALFRKLGYNFNSYFSKSVDTKQYIKARLATSSYRLEHLCKQLGIEHNAHDALGDVLALMQVVEKVEGLC